MNSTNYLLYFYISKNIIMTLRPRTNITASVSDKTPVAPDDVLLNDGWCTYVKGPVCGLQVKSSEV